LDEKCLNLHGNFESSVGIATNERMNFLADIFNSKACCWNSSKGRKKRDRADGDDFLQLSQFTYAMYKIDQDALEKL
jgi:hypothetical protein